jgi:acyl-CoA thioesterase-2
MSRTLEELVHLLALERIDEDLFRGLSEDLGWGRLYGGHVLAQALSAAIQTVTPDRRVHSVHGYFLLSGDVSIPVIYDVDRIRDGGSFTTRRVVAKQRGKAIFHLSASFQTHEDGFEHQDEMPSVPDPDGVPNEEDAMAKLGHRMPAPLRARLHEPRPFDFRPIQPALDPIAPSPLPPRRDVWIRGRGSLGDDPALHATLLAYVSDFYFVGTSLLPHGVSWLSPGMQVASLDHAMWFHADLRADDWLLHSMESPRASAGRGLVRGRVFARDGRLVASSIQEGLIRRRPAPP